MYGLGCTVSCGLRFIETCLELANDSPLCSSRYCTFRACVRASWVTIASSIRAISLVYYVPLYVVQTRGGWLRAARSIPKVALAYRLQHARAARVYWSVAAPAPISSSPTDEHETIFCRLCSCVYLRENSPSFPRDVSRVMQDIDNTMTILYKTLLICLDKILKSEKKKHFHNLVWFIKKLW